MTIANAGHISPYLEGREVELENGLPLGIGAKTAYGEARGAKGELLGFERMAALTSKPATEIADAAQRWGQDDDITVLTVRRLAVLTPVL